MLKVYVRYCMIVEKIHENISFEQSKRLEQVISFITQKRSESKNYFEKDFYKVLNKAAFGKMMEKVRNRPSSELH